MQVRNDTDSERYWPDVQDSTGHTLQLRPGETADIEWEGDLPAGLVAVKHRKPTPAADAAE